MNFESEPREATFQHVLPKGQGADTVVDRPIVFLIDDDVSVRESLEAVIVNDGWACRTFASARDFLEQQGVGVPCCLVLDLNLPGLSGLELQQLIAGRWVQMPIIFITGFGDVPSSVRAMKAGAAEFLVKPVEVPVLLEAIHSALETSRGVLQDEVQLQTLRERVASLSAREREVMDLVCSGLMNKQVAGELGISEITVKAHRGQVMRKMGARSFAALVKMSESIAERSKT